MLELAKECERMGRPLSPAVLYTDDPVFGEFVKREREAELMLQVENDIIAALTFNRWRQQHPDKAGSVNAELDYTKLEY